MRFQQYLTELFKEKRDFDVAAKWEDTFKARFTVNSIPFEFTAEREDEDTDHGEVNFENKSMDYQNDMDITGTMKEGALEVYSYIISITKYFLELYEPKRVNIEGFRDEQAKLYKKLVKRFSKEIEKIGYNTRTTPVDITLIRRG